MSYQIQDISTELLDSHPDNPRLFLRQDVVDGIAVQLQEKGFFDPAHALLVRPLNGRYQIIRGHQRKAAAVKAGLDTVPCWVREMPDEDAYWELGLSNAQGELTPLEIGRHALGIEDGEAGRGKKGGLSDYARQMGKQRQNIDLYRKGAKVFEHFIKRNPHIDVQIFEDKVIHLSCAYKFTDEISDVLTAWIITPIKPDKPDKTPTVNQTENMVKEVCKFNPPKLWQAIFLPLVDVVQDYVKNGKPKPKEVAEIIIEADSIKRDILTLQREFKFNVGLFPFTVQGFYDWLRDGKGTYAWDIGELRQYHQQVREAAERARELPIPNCKQGEWYKLGKHLLYCGDTGKPEFWARLPKVTFAFADPPYNADAADWDADFKWGHDWLIERASVVAVTPGIGSIQRFFKEVTSMPYVWSMSAWIKNGMTRGAIGFGNWIYIALFATESVWRQAQDAMPIECTINLSDQRSEHRGRKPPELIQKLITLFSEQGEVIIDPFLGSGTTLFEADRLGRVCIGGEINPDFCDDIIGYWQKQTGQVARRLVDGFHTL